jgi:hypothetical protein
MKCAFIRMKYAATVSFNLINRTPAGNNPDVFKLLFHQSFAVLPGRKMEQ